ncbi:hypothetical protein BHE74_00009251, partial [Ensete ventricosum]
SGAVAVAVALLRGQAFDGWEEGQSGGGRVRVQDVQPPVPDVPGARRPPDQPQAPEANEPASSEKCHAHCITNNYWRVVCNLKCYHSITAKGN